MAPKAKKAEPASELVVHAAAQGSEEWFKARLGIPTASYFSTILAEGEGIGRKKYLCRLAGEVLTGVPAEETYRSRAMERGNEMEPAAIEDYERRRGVEVQRVGFATNFSGLRLCGASPDGLVGFDGGVETKTMRPDLMIPLLLRGSAMPAEYRAQVQGNMLVFERAWWDLKVYYPGMPDFTVRVFRDEAYIRELHGQIERFNFDLKQLVKQLRSMGAS
jgi:hypothetical protein